MVILWDRRSLRLGALFLALSLLLPLGVSRADTLPELVQYLTQEHNLVKAAEEDVNAARQRARVALGDWFPNLDVSTSYGFEEQIQPGSNDTRFVTRDVDLKVSQLLWDFGKTNATLRRAGLVLEQTLAVLDGVRQNVLLRGVTAYLNVSRRTQVLKFAQRSEDNIKKQADLENALVVAGKGFSTDVLQAKARLAGAEARRIAAHGGLQVAKNDYRALFERDPDSIYSQGIVHLPYESLPLALEDAVRTALEFNPSLKSESFGIKIAGEDVNSTRSDAFYPRLQGVLEQRYKKDFSGTVGSQRESLGKVELTFPFNLGFTSVNKLRAAKHDQSATIRRVRDRKDIVEQQTRDAWVSLYTSRQRTASLRNQAEIVMRFLADARKERKAGRRSLLDVLDGETQLLNAQSDAASAEIDEAIAIFTLFEAMGQLKESVILGRKSGEYQPEPRVKSDFGERRNRGTKIKAVRKITTPSKKDSEIVSPHVEPSQVDEKSKIKARVPTEKVISSDPVVAQPKPRQIPETETEVYRLEKADAIRAEKELKEPEPPTADSESTIFDLLAGIGQFFESHGDPGETDESESGSEEAVVAELKARPETSVASEKEPSLTPKPDQLPQADSGLSGSELAAALQAEYELEEMGPPTVDSDPTLNDLLASIGRFFESVIDPGETAQFEPEQIETAELTTAVEAAEAKTPPQFSETLETEEPDGEPNMVRTESAETAPIATADQEPPFAELETAVYDLLARIGQFFVSAIEAGEPDHSVLVGTGVAEFKAPPKTLK